MSESNDGGLFFYAITACLLLAAGSAIMARVDRVIDSREAARTYVYICKRMPAKGQLDWVDWLHRSGQCELATSQ